MLALPGTNAATERVLFIINALRIDEKNRFSMEIIDRIHFQDISCADFHKILLENVELLNDVHSSAKYNKQAFWKPSGQLRVRNR